MEKKMGLKKKEKVDRLSALFIHLHCFSGQDAMQIHLICPLHSSSLLLR